MRGNHKYGAKATICTAAHNHPSKREAKRCDELHLLQRAGEISRLETQPQFWFAINGEQVKHENGRRVGYKPDFQYFEGQLNVVEEVKPASVAARSPDYPLRKAIFRALFPFITFREV